MQPLATSLGLSVPFLSQVEGSLDHRSLFSLEAIAETLDVDVDYLVGVPTPTQIACCAGEHERLDRKSPVAYEPLSGLHAERKMEVLRLVVPPSQVAPTIYREGGDSGTS